MVITNSYQAMENLSLDKLQLLNGHPHPLHSNPPELPTIGRALSHGPGTPAQAVGQLTAPARTNKLSEFPTVDNYDLEKDEDEKDSRQASCRSTCW